MRVSGIERVRDQLRDARVEGEADVADRVEWAGSPGRNSFFAPVSRMNDVSCGVTRRSAREAITVYFTSGLGDRSGGQLPATSDPPTMIWSQAGQPKFAQYLVDKKGRRPR